MRILVHSIEYYSREREFYCFRGVPTYHTFESKLSPWSGSVSTSSVKVCIACLNEVTKRSKISVFAIRGLFSLYSGLKARLRGYYES